MPGKRVFTLQAKDSDTSSTQMISYKIDRISFKRGGKVSPFNGIFEIKQDAGDIRSVKNLTDFAGGLFEVSVSAIEQENDVSHLAHTILNVSFCIFDAM